MKKRILQYRSYQQSGQTPLRKGALAVAVSLSLTAQAESTDVSAAGAVMEQVIVSARQRDELIQDVPVAITAVSAAELEKYSITTVQDAAKMVPTLMVGRASSGAGSVIYMRGVGTGSLSRGFEQSISINIDNVQISRGNAINIGYFDMAQLEVMKGPQALFFGKNSPGGIIAIRSQDPTVNPEFSIKTGYEFVARQAYGEAVASGPINDVVKARVAVRGSRADGYFHNDAESFNDPRGFITYGASDDRYPNVREMAGRLTLTFDPTDNFTSRLKIFGSNVEGQPVVRQNIRCLPGPLASPVFGVVDRADDCKSNDQTSIYASNEAISDYFPHARDGKPFTDNEVILSSLDWTYSFDSLDLTSVTAYYRNRQAQYSTFSVGQFSANEMQDYTALSQELRATTNFDGPVNATFGAYFQTTDFPVSNSALFANTPVDPITGKRHSAEQDIESDSDTQSVFGEVAWQITDEVELSGGARVTWEQKSIDYNMPYVAPALRTRFRMNDPLKDDLSDNNVSPQITLSYKPTADMLLYAAYRTGYKSGGYNQSQYIGATTRIEDIEFEPEEAKGFELGSKMTLLDGRMQLNTTFYAFEYTDLQVLVFDPVNVAYNVANAGKLMTRGVEVEGTYNFGDGDRDLSLHWAGAWNDAQYKDYVGQCFTGQTVAEGCNRLPNAAGTVFNGQDYDGRTPPRAPEWSLSAGLVYGIPLNDKLELTFTGDARYTSKFITTDTLRPDSYQGEYTLFDASIRLRDINDTWSLALIGRNLTDEVIYYGSIDQTSQGGGTGTAAGTRADLVATTETGRAVSLELIHKF